MSREKETGFLDRWSARKRGVAAETSAGDFATDGPGTEEPDLPEDERTDEEILADAGLKDPDLLEQGDDFSAYLKSALPDRIKKRVLRKLWVSNPVLANLDGLCDYDDDFTDAAMVVPDMKTLYQVGKGMFREVLEDDAEADETAPAEATEEAPADTDGMLAEKGGDDPAETPNSLRSGPAESDLNETESPTETAGIATLGDQNPPSQRRHMRFRYQSRG